MKQAAKEAFSSSKTSIEQIRAIARAYCMLILWLRKNYPSVISANSNLPENRFRICRRKEEIDELPEDSVDILCYYHPHLHHGEDYCGQNSSTTLGNLGNREPEELPP